MEAAMAGKVVTVGAAKFKATCLELIDKVGQGEIDSVVVSKRGKPVAQLRAVEAQTEDEPDIYGRHPGSAVFAPGFDPTQPLDPEWYATKD
jgi:antitoxin (DNA-binding transcriptional repressor) of toxin-antitoxin stability system